jgi:hypothetical protein
MQFLEVVVTNNTSMVYCWNENTCVYEVLKLVKTNFTSISWCDVDIGIIGCFDFWGIVSALLSNCLKNLICFSRAAIQLFW